MLEMILDKHVIWVIIGLGAAAGVVSKCIVNVSLKRLMRGAGNMGKSTHPFMRLVRAASVWQQGFWAGSSSIREME